MPPPALDQWRKLYDTAAKVRDLTPWAWMEEMDVFGVQDPQTGEIGYVSVMGMLGEYLAVHVYRGSLAIQRFEIIHQEGRNTPLEYLLETPQLQLSFVGRDELDADDRKLNKQVNFKGRGANAWLQFRTLRAGYAPHLPDEAADVQQLTTALEQLIELLPRLKTNPGLLEVGEGLYLVRVQRPDGTWEDKALKPPPAALPNIVLQMDLTLLNKVKELAVTPMDIQADLFLLPTMMRDHQYPYFVYIMLLVDPHAMIPLDFETLKPYPVLEDMYGSLPLVIVKMFNKLGIRPQTLSVRSPALARLLASTCEELGIELRRAKRLRALETVRQGMMDLIGGLT
jgi:hypothetical protein